MARITNVATVEGTIDGRGNRTVAYTLVLDSGKKQALTLVVSGDRNRVRALLAATHGVDPADVSFDPHYDD